MTILFIVLAVAVVIAFVVYGIVAERKRREAFQVLAARLGLRFRPNEDYALAASYGFLDDLARGDNRYAFNVLSGAFRNQNVTAFDYHYETHSTDSKGRRSTQHHYLSCLTLLLPQTFPELRIGPEGFFSRIAQAFGYDDIDFESHEFSRAFVVRSRDKRFAYDFCHARAMEYLLSNSDLEIEVESNVLAICFDSRLDPERVEYNLGRLIALRELMPEYLFAGGPHPC